MSIYIQELWGNSTSQSATNSSSQFGNNRVFA